MDRLIYKDLLEWKISTHRKPLILYGARQTGKTWLLKELGQRDYKRTLYLNFDTDHRIHSFFGDDISPQIVIRNLENHFNEKIDPLNTLIVFDEIQECQRAKDSLKYFNEDARHYHIAAAGSFLGIAGGKFPVGQVNELTLYPLSFSEFLEATGCGLLAETLREKNCKRNGIPQIAASHEMLVEKLKEYFFCGGMPEAVKTLAETGSFIEVRKVQEVILNNYKNDFSKHISAANIPKVRMLWDSVPVHLAKEKKKFMYKEIKAGGRAGEFENAMNWLVSTGLVYKIEKTVTPRIPLSAYEEREHFKIFMLDIGLLGVKAGLNAAALLDDKTLFTEFKGALAEQFVLQELKVSGNSPVFYWGNESGKAEVDFIIQFENEIIPIEVKSSVNTKSQSLSVYREKYRPARAVRISLKNIGTGGEIFSLPLYLIGSLEELLKNPSL